VDYYIQSTYGAKGQLVRGEVEVGRIRGCNHGPWDEYGSWVTWELIRLFVFWLHCGRGQEGKNNEMIICG